MQINRLFEIVYILLSKKITTAKELAERFEVSERTIYRDIDTLSSAGIPIYASQGKGGGISLMEHYVLNKSVLSENEQNEILFALQSLTVTQNPETDRVLSKLSSFFHKSNINWIEVDLSPWGSDKNKTCEFTILKKRNPEPSGHCVLLFQCSRGKKQPESRACQADVQGECMVSARLLLIKK